MSEKHRDRDQKQGVNRTIITKMTGESITVKKRCNTLKRAKQCGFCDGNKQLVLNQARRDILMILLKQQKIQIKKSTCYIDSLQVLHAQTRTHISEGRKYAPTL